MKTTNDEQQQHPSISLSDLPAQVSRDSKPCFALLMLTEEPQSSMNGSHFIDAAQHLAGKLGIAVEVVEVLAPNSEFLQSNSNQNDIHLIVKETPHSDQRLLLLEEHRPSVWLIRPDGHVAGGIAGPEIENEQQDQDKLLQYAIEALFGMECF